MIAAHVLAPDRVEGGRRLVEDHQRRVAQQRGRQPEALLHALREAAGPVVGAVGEADEGEDPLDLRAPVLPRQPGELRVEGQHLARGQPGLVAEQLGQIAHAASRLAVADRAAEDLARPCRRPREPEEELDRRGLAGAVGTEEAEHLARVDAEVEVVEGDGPAVDLAQAMGLDRGGRHACILGGDLDVMWNGVTA